MSRACILSNGGDPLISSLALKLWKRDWYEEIDRMYVCFNNNCGVPQSVVSEFMGKIVEDPKVHVIYHPTGIGNGVPIKEGLLISQEDNILLLEDDFFIYTSGVVDSYFKHIESGEVDLLGSPRYSVGEVAESAKAKYKLDFSGLGDRGMSWWPTGFYAKRADLLKTDLDFGSKRYGKGEYFKELDYTFKEDNYTDTFTWASLQLRYLGLKSADIPQYHASPKEVEDRRDQKMNWEGGKIPPYIHGGSLSTSYGGYLSGVAPDISNENAIWEMETRVAFWRIVSDVIEGFDSFKEEYKKGIEQLSVHLDEDRIQQKYLLYRDLLKI